MLASPALALGALLLSASVPVGCRAAVGCRFGLPQLTVDQRGQPRKTEGNGDGLARRDTPAPLAGQVRVGALELQLS